MKDLVCELGSLKSRGRDKYKQKLDYPSHHLKFWPSGEAVGHRKVLDNIEQFWLYGFHRHDLCTSQALLSLLERKQKKLGR